MIRPSFHLHGFDYPMHQCFHCQNRPEGILTELDGSEIRVCKSCGNRILKKLKRKFKRFSKSRSKCLDNQKQTILGQIHTQNNEQIGIEEETEADLDEDYCPQCESYVKSGSFIMDEGCCLKCHGRNSV